MSLSLTHKNVIDSLGNPLKEGDIVFIALPKVLSGSYIDRIAAIWATTAYEEILPEKYPHWIGTKYCLKL